MVSRQEKLAQVQEFFKFDKGELFGLVAVVLVTAFVFSFRDWGIGQFNATTGIRNLFVTGLVVLVTILVKLSAQKIKGLNEGYRGEFKPWWSGLAAALVFAVISAGRIPLVLIGTITNTFIVKQRLGEFRYGFSYTDNASIASTGIISNLSLATLSAIGWYFVPDSYLLGQALLLNLVMAICSLVPIKQMDGLNLFFGDRINYFFYLGLTAIYWLLLISKTRIGLILAIIIITLIVITRMLKSSEK